MADKRPVVIFGTGGFAEVVDFYLERDSGYRAVAFTATRDALNVDSFSGRPAIPFDEIEQQFPPNAHEMFVAVGYAKLNRLRERFCNEARTKGYKLLSYVCSKATSWGDTRIGDNVFIFEDNTLQSFVSIGDGSILWSGNHIGHHSRIGNYCFITSHVVVSGYCSIGDRTFIGVNAAITDAITVAEDNLIGAGSVVEKDTAPNDAYLPERLKKFPKPSGWFFR